jgi:threonine dehydrogenase-like Zn-dependent dehydrogenase
VGTLPENFAFPGNLIMSRELNVLGSFRFAHVFQDVMNLVASGSIKLDGIVTDVYQYNDFPTAMQRAMAKDRVMKVQVAN